MEEFFEKNIQEFTDETKSRVGKNILDNFEKELNKFVQVCPTEMIDKLKNPITMKLNKKIS